MRFLELRKSCINWILHWVNIHLVQNYSTSANLSSKFFWHAKNGVFVYEKKSVKVHHYITRCLKRMYIKVCLFSKHEINKKKSSANLQIFVVICCKIQGQFVISTLKTEITKWSQIWCLHMLILTEIVENAS